MSNDEAIIRTPNTEHRTPNTEHRTPNTEHRTPNTEHHDSALKILVCCHKPCTMPFQDDGILLPIQVGKALTDLDLHIQGDNELNGQPCDNISHKNENYAELTAMYWAWKNLKKLYPDVKYVGLYHYRRYFAFNETQYFSVTINKPESGLMDYRVDSEKIAQILESSRIIVAKRLLMMYSAFTHCCIYNAKEDWIALTRVIEDKFPDYSEAFNKVLMHNNKISFFNMFIMKYEDFVQYCEWLFAVLAEVEPLLPYQYYRPGQKRILGVMGERLLNVYIAKHHIKTKRFNVYKYIADESGMPQTPLRKFVRYIADVAVFLKIELVFRLSELSLRRFIKKLVRH